MNIILSKECLGLGCSPVIESLPSMREGQSSILQTKKQTNRNISENRRVPIEDFRFTLANFCFLFCFPSPSFPACSAVCLSVSHLYISIICQSPFFPVVGRITKSVETLRHNSHDIILSSSPRELGTFDIPEAPPHCSQTLLTLNVVLYSIAHTSSVYLALPICSTYRLLCPFPTVLE